MLFWNAGPMALRTSLYLLLLLLGSCRAQYGLLNIFNSVLNISDDPAEGLSQDTIEFRTEYDFLIIGSGSGGSVVANRLTEISDWHVLLLEAGRDETFITEVPLSAAFLEITPYNWGYKAEKQSKACIGLTGGRCNWPSGKALGGTSVTNYMLYTRGNRLDFDEWQSLGNNGWSYQDVLPYFIKSERAVDMHDIDPEFHGTDGYLNVEHAPYKTPLVERFLRASNEFGYPVTDINGPTPLGFCRAQATMRKGRRCSASKAFLRPVRKRPNLHITKEARVTKIIIDPETKRTVGVEFRKNNQRYRVRAKKEVILSAGAMNSPQLLMLAGVGPREHLQKLNIPVIQDLPVGYNLQDHVSLPGLAFVVNDSVTIIDYRIQNPSDIYDNIVNRKGPFTIPGGAEAYAFVKTNYSQSDYPDIELVLGSGAISGDTIGVIRNLLSIPQRFYDDVFRDIQGLDAFSLIPILMRPRSRGRIMLKNKNPLRAPLIYPNYFDDEHDLNVLVEGAKMAAAVGESQSFQRFNSKLNTRPYPGCQHLQFRSDAYWRCCIQRYTSSLYHPVGTCKMGPPEDLSSVVDSQLRVHGIIGLRVVDASIMPNIVAGHPNAVVYMIGEKASDMIKDTWRHEITPGF